MEGRHPPVEAAAGRLLGAGERGADHHRVGAAGDRLRNVTAGAHATVGDHVHVLARLEQVLDAGGRRVGDGRGLRDADAEHAAGRARVAGADSDENAFCGGSHQVQGGLVGGAAADDHGYGQLGDELLQVERLPVRGDVLGRDDGALDDEDVEPGLQRGLVVLAHALRGERAGREHTRLLDLADSGGDQLRLDRLGVDLLHPLRRLLLGQAGDLLELALGVLVAGKDAFEVEDAEAAEAAELDRDLRRDDAVHRRSDQRQLEQVRAELPADVDVLRVARAPRGHDRDVVEPVRLACLLPSADLDLHATRPPSMHETQAPSGSPGPKNRSQSRLSIGMRSYHRRWTIGASAQGLSRDRPLSGRPRPAPAGRPRPRRRDDPTRAARTALRRARGSRPHRRPRRYGGPPRPSGPRAAPR